VLRGFHLSRLKSVQFLTKLQKCNLVDICATHWGQSKKASLNFAAASQPLRQSRLTALLNRNRFDVSFRHGIARPIATNL
jgi:hypothetical protein